MALKVQTCDMICYLIKKTKEIMHGSSKGFSKGYNDDKGGLKRLKVPKKLSSV